METFVDALIYEIGMYAPYAPKENIETIFFGGGTPSLLSNDALSRIFESIHKHFTIHTGAEITLEANPGTVEREKLLHYRKLGINRLSYGVQSFHQDELEFLGRIHDKQQAIISVKLAQDVGFDNMNIDLIFSLPNQTIERWNSTLEQAVALGTQHISAYSLIVEPNTPLYRMVESKQIIPSPTEEDAEMYEFTMSFLKEHGFRHYEVSNYARTGNISRHNMNYWNHSNYIGFGPSAHSFWVDRRWWNVKNLQLYIDRIAANKVPVEGEETLTKQQAFDESIMLGLRSSGINLGKIQSQFSVDLLIKHRATVDELVSDGLIEVDEKVLRLTDKGYLICDSVAESLLVEVN